MLTYIDITLIDITLFAILLSKQIDFQILNLNFEFVGIHHCFEDPQAMSISAFGSIFSEYVDKCCGFRQFSLKYRALQAVFDSESDFSLLKALV